MTLSPLRGGLFIAECARFSFLTGIMAILRFNANADFPWQIYAVPNALFLLMALFSWLDTSKYGAYVMLYIAGKALCLFSEISSLFIFSRQSSTMNFYEAWITNPGIVLSLVLICDLLTLSLALLISYKKNKNPEAALSGSQPEVAAADTGESEGHGGM